MSGLRPFPVLSDPGKSLDPPPTVKLYQLAHHSSPCEEYQSATCQECQCAENHRSNHPHCPVNLLASSPLLNSAMIALPSETAHQLCGLPAHMPGTSTVKLPPGGLLGRRAAASTIDKGSIGSPGGGFISRNGVVRRSFIDLNLRRSPGTPGAVAREPMGPIPPVHPRLSGALFARHCHSAAAAARRGKRAGPHSSVERA